MRKGVVSQKRNFVPGRDVVAFWTLPRFVFWELFQKLLFEVVERMVFHVAGLFLSLIAKAAL